MEPYDSLKSELFAIKEIFCVPENRDVYRDVSYNLNLFSNDYAWFIKQFALLDFSIIR